MNTLKSLLIAVVLFASTSVFAKTGKLLDETKTAAIDVVIEQQRSGKVIVGFEKFGSDIVKIKIYDEEGNAVYSERVKKATLMLKRFDVSLLPEGDYSYEVSIADYAVEKTITK
ncbi:hypothetical protein [Reichenbachiella versicolor]|uniref:hypothetical protein n=1 Tax=Reichenbachiella versicolor TaxID=1821036 RepID=UPI000D6DE316|nr:hypothetical protein [Reichenbachiella versicolor]